MSQGQRVRQAGARHPGRRKAGFASAPQPSRPHGILRDNPRSACRGCPKMLLNTARPSDDQLCRPGQGAGWLAVSDLLVPAESNPLFTCSAV